MAASPTLAGLRRLGLSNNEVTDEGAKALAESAHLARLRSLSLRANPLTVTGVTALAESAVLGQLRSLDLGYLGLNDDAAAILAGSTPLANLASLVLASNKITGASNSHARNLAAEGRRSAIRLSVASALPRASATHMRSAISSISEI